METDIKYEDKLKDIETDVAVLVPQAEKLLVINKEAQVVEATEVVGTLQGRIKRIEALRVEFTKPLLDHKKKIDDQFKAQSLPLEAIVTKVKRAIGTFAMEQEKIAREKEAKEREKHEAKMEKQAEEGKPVDLAPAPQVERREATVKTEAGKTTTKKVWKFEIEDVHALPLKQRKAVLELAMQKGLADTVIRKFVTAGEREIKGVRIWEEMSVSVSAN